MGQFTQARQVLALSSTTTPALVTASAGSSSGGVGSGRIDDTLIMVEVTCSGSGLTGASFSVWGSRDRLAWVRLPVRDASGEELSSTLTLSGAPGSTVAAGLVCEAARGWPWLDVRASAVGADAVAGDSVAAYLPPIY